MSQNSILYHCGDKTCYKQQLFPKMNNNRNDTGKILGSNKNQINSLDNFKTSEF